MVRLGQNQPLEQTIFHNILQNDKKNYTLLLKEISCIFQNRTNSGLDYDINTLQKFQRKLFALAGRFQSQNSEMSCSDYFYFSGKFQPKSRNLLL